MTCKVEYDILFAKKYILIQDPMIWWLKFENTNIGYFFIALFSNMAWAEQVGWGGRTYACTHTPSPPMGFKYFPDNNFVNVCFFRHVSFKNDSKQDYGHVIM